MAQRFLVVDDHPLFRAALRTVLADRAEIGELGAIEELAACLRQDPEIDLILLDLHLPGAHGYSGLLLIRSEFPQVPVLVVSAIEEAEVVQRCLALGAAGYLRKTAPPDAIRDAIATVLRGESWPRGAAGLPAADGGSWRRLSSLSPQQVRVLMKLSQGLMNKQIAHELSIAEATVKVHVSAILQRLGVDTRTQAAMLARSLERPGLSALEQPPSATR
jgi:DNA-binding NarL/FixJ family response regulator